MAAGREMRARLLLVLGDGISRGLGGIQQRLDAISSAARRIGGIGAAIGALSFAGPTRQAADFETKLRDLEITAGRTGLAIEAAMRRSRGELYQMATRTRIASTDLLEARSVLTGRGMEPADITALMPLIANVAGASGAAARDLANLNIAASRNAHIGADQIRMANAIFLRAGQMGGFELKDTARYVPSLMAQIALLKVSGLEAAHTLGAGLQVVLEGFGGDAAQAGAGFQQLIGHILSDHTVKEMAKFNEDLNSIFRNAQVRGINPFEALLESMRRVIAVDPTRAMQIMPDQNSRQTLLALLDGRQRYAEIRRDLASTSPDIIDQGLIDRTRGLGAELRLTTELLGQLGTRIGDAAGTGLPLLNAGLELLLKHIADLDARFPGMLDSTVKWLAGLTLVSGVLGVAVPVARFFAGGLGMLARPLGFLLRILGLLMWPLRVMMAALLAAGAGATASAAFVAAFGAAVAYAAYRIITNWAEVRALLVRIWDDPKKAFSEFVAVMDSWTGGAITAVLNGLEGKFRWLADAVNATLEALTSLSREVERRIGATPDRPAPTPDQRAGRIGSAGRARAIREGFGYGEEAFPDSRAKLGGRLVVALEDGLVVRRAETASPGFELSVTGIRGGAFLGRD